MILTRKFLSALMILFGFVMVALGVYTAIEFTQAQQAEESLRRETLQNAFIERLEGLEQVAAALATDASSDNQIQAALAAGDRDQLLSLTQSTYYRQLNIGLPVELYEYHIPPGISFLRVDNPGQFGEDLTATRRMVTAANSERRLYRGIELDPSGLNVRAVNPVYYLGAPVGSVEFGLRIDAELLAGLKEKYKVDWQINILRSAARQARYQGGTLSERWAATRDLYYEVTTLSSPVYAPPAVYERVLQGSTETNLVEAGDRTYTIFTMPLQDFEGKIIGVVDIVEDSSDRITGMVTRYMELGGAALLGLLFTAGGATLLIRRSFGPLGSLNRLVAELAAGNMARRVPEDQPDELGQLAGSINRIADRFVEVRDALESKLGERTAELEHRSQTIQITSDLAREMGSARNLDTLLDETIERICLRFGFYHGAIFLIDELGEYAYLRAAAGSGRQQLRQRNLRLRVGQEGLVGYVAAQGRARVASDVSQDETYLPEGLLSATRSEVALPLRFGAQVLGVVDLQSTEPNAITADDVNLLQALADQLAIAIRNLRLQADLEENRRKTEQIVQHQSRNAWALSLARAREEQRAFEYDRLQVKPLADRLPPEVSAAVEQGKSVQTRLRRRTNGNGNGSAWPEQEVAALIVPVILRDQVIGVIGLEDDDPEHRWAADEVLIVETAANQAALTLENVRLLSETRRNVERQAFIGQVVSRVRETLDIDTVLKTAIVEIGSALDVAEVEVRMGTGDA